MIRGGRPRPAIRPIAGVAILLAVVVVAPVRSTATFTTSRSASPMTLASRTWSLYLHNRPTPPTANTDCQVDLTMNTTAPTAATLYHYSTPCFGAIAFGGRIVQRTNLTAGDPTLTDKQYVDWWGPEATVAQRYDRTAGLVIWAQPKAHGTSASFTAYLRDRSGGVVTEITSATYASTTWPGQDAFVLVELPLPTHLTLAVGHRFELRLMVPGASKDDLVFAYDTTAYTATLRVP